MQIDKRALGLAIGVVWGGALFLVTLWSAYRGAGQHLYLLKQFYLGYGVSVGGAFVGLAWGFVDGFIGGWLLGWLYNRFAGASR